MMAWADPPKVDIVSTPFQHEKVFQHRAAVDALAQVTLVPTPPTSPVLAWRATTLAAFPQ